MDLPERARALQRVSSANASQESGSGPGINYVLSATNSTLIPLLRAHAGRVTNEPLIVYITTNVTLTWARLGSNSSYAASSATGSSQELAVGGIPVNRPLVLVGSALRNTSIDFGMDVNLLNLLASPYANVTFDSLVLENLGPGDALTAKYANGASLSVTSVMFPLLFERYAVAASHLKWSASDCSWGLKQAATSSRLCSNVERVVRCGTEEIRGHCSCASHLADDS